MPDIVAFNGRDALIRVARAVLEQGREVAPRGMATKELEHLTVEITNPYDVLCTGIGANQSTEVVAAEAIQLIGGFSDPVFAIKHAPAVAAFTNDEGEFDGAYGPRLLTQYADLVRRLKSDADTRQAMLTIWRESDLARQESKDYPCTLVFGFAIRRDKLNLSVVMRSNDVNWGFKNDIFQFTQLQLTIANQLSIPAGVYRHTAFSMHLYERDWEWVNALNDDFIGECISDHPAGIFGRTPLAVRVIAHDLAYGTKRAEACGWSVDHPSHRWYSKQLHGGC